MKSKLIICLFMTNALAAQALAMALNNKCAQLEQKYQAWCYEREKREAKLEKYLLDNKEARDIFLSGANRRQPGFLPALMFAVFPDLFPDIWGSDQSFEKPGLTSNPYSKMAFIPTGMALSKKDTSRFPEIKGTLGAYKDKSIDMNLVGFNCAACHSSVMKNEDGQSKLLVGAPNHRLNNLLFLYARTSLHPNFSADKFKEAIRSKGKNWNFYGDPSMREQSQREIDFFLKDDVAENWVALAQVSGKKLFGAFKAFIQPKLYSSKNSPNPLAQKRGSLDAFFATFFSYIGFIGAQAPSQLSQGERVAWINQQLEDKLPNRPAEIDNPAVWNQRGRGDNHWGGEFVALLPRNLSTAAAARLVPVHFENVQTITEFIQDLPAPVYPFNVDLARAKRGEKLFKQYCLSCHSGENKYYSVEEVGTSPNRSKHLGQYVLSFLQDQLMNICDRPEACQNDDGSPYRPTDVAVATQGYQADRLDGIWARSPYFHNGSVPSLETLLIPDMRPEVFQRGAFTLNQDEVGYNYKKAIDGVTVPYDTKLSGNSNRGHSSEKYLGIDWKKNPEKRMDLLEYLKTL